MHSRPLALMAIHGPALLLSLVQLKAKCTDLALIPSGRPRDEGQSTWCVFCEFGEINSFHFSTLTLAPSNDPSPFGDTCSIKGWVH